VAAPVSSGFGTRVHPILGDVRMHTGMDYAAGTGAPIKAAGNGIVVWAGPRGGYGNAVIIDHRNGLATLYGHQSRVNVTVGQKVSTGQVVGFVGQTGMATGPHLHFEVRELGTPVDPALYL
jgi:murein DD-endopeptidase MepM/ murein hydrolase activator NlpD